MRKRGIGREVLYEALLDRSYLLAVLVGISLRLYQIHLQVIADDEWHSLHALMTGSYASIVSHFGSTDYCIPLTLFFKLAYDLYGLSEWIMLLPVPLGVRAG